MEVSDIESRTSFPFIHEQEAVKKKKTLAASKGFFSVAILARSCLEGCRLRVAWQARLQGQPQVRIAKIKKNFAASKGVFFVAILDHVLHKVADILNKVLI